MTTDDDFMPDEAAKEIAYEWLAMAHPHEAYDDDPERFWALFHRKHPDVPRSAMEHLLYFHDRRPEKLNE